jgi:nucleotide-binding universal stress UspA family protein
MTVLVACNTSAHGEAALRAGIAEAVRRRLPLAVLVLDPPPGGEATVPSPLAEALATVPEDVIVESVTFRREEDEPADAILDAVDAIAATLVVVGSRKRSSDGTFMMGTTTQRVLLDAPAPVLVVKDVYDTP